MERISTFYVPLVHMFVGGSFCNYLTLSVRICPQKDSSTFLSCYRHVSYIGVCLLALCLIPISSVPALLFPAAGSGGGFLRGVGCGGERGRGDETDVVVGGSQSTTKYNDNVLALLSMCSG